MRNVIPILSADIMATGQQPSEGLRPSSFSIAMISSLGAQQTQEELMRQGMSATEAGRQVVRHNLIATLAARIVDGLKMLMLAAASVPVLCVGLIWLLGSHGLADVLLDCLFRHLADECDQPLGELLAVYWVSVFVPVMVFLASQCRCCEEACPNWCSCFEFWFKALIVLPVSYLWMVWPPMALYSSVRTRSCSSHLRAQAWSLLGLYCFGVVCLGVYCSWPVLRRSLYWHQILPDPGSIANHFEKVAYRQDLFKDNGAEDSYPVVCPICFDNFADGQEIIRTPCAGRQHIFHRACLADWLRLNQTCPLCRTLLAAEGRRSLTAASRDVELGIREQRREAIRRPLS